MYFYCQWSKRDISPRITRACDISVMLAIQYVCLQAKIA